MKKLLKLKNVLIAIAFTVFLLLVKDNMGVVGDILNKIITILTPFFLGFMIAYILNFNRCRSSARICCSSPSSRR